MSNNNLFSDEMAQISLDELTELVKQNITKVVEDKVALIQDLYNDIIEVTKLVKVKYKTIANRRTYFTNNYKDLMSNRYILQKIINIQNNLNFYINQQLILTAVIKNDKGEREIFIGNNSISHLNKSLEYSMKKISDQCKRLQVSNEFEQHELQLLQSTANEVEDRESNKDYNHWVMWKIHNKWQVIRMFNKGPIDEAFTAFYIHEYKLPGSIENFHTNNEIPINAFIMHKKYGALKADTAPGTILGDVQLSGNNQLQFMVKGSSSHLQGFSEVLAQLKLLIEQNLTPEELINKFLLWAQFRQEDEVQVKPLIKNIGDYTIDKELTALLSSISVDMSK